MPATEAAERLRAFRKIANQHVGFVVCDRDMTIIAIVDAKEGGLYRSDDAGATWRKVNNANPRPMYFSKVRIDPNDLSPVTRKYIAASARRGRKASGT